MDVAIYEDGEQTGRVNLDERTFEYDGSNEDIRKILTQMENDEITATQPSIPNDSSDASDESDKTTFESKHGRDEANHREGVEVNVMSGKMLGRFLQRVIPNSSRSGEVRIEASDGSLEADVISLDDEATEGATSDDGDSNSFPDSDFEATYGPPDE